MVFSLGLAALIEGREALLHANVVNGSEFVAGNGLVARRLQLPVDVDGLGVIHNARGREKVQG